MPINILFRFFGPLIGLTLLSCTAQIYYVGRPPSPTGPLRAKLVSRSGATVDFGTLNCATSSVQPIRIVNEGPGTAFNASVTFDKLQFTSVTHDCDTLAAGETCTIDVRFTPTRSGLQNSDLKISYQDNASAGFVTVGLSGSGVATNTWVGGPNTPNQGGTYGTRGVADPANIPGARTYSAFWYDASGNLWLYGGANNTGGNGLLGDLWKLSGSQWTWVNGSSTQDVVPVYGTKGIADPSNFPGSRRGMAYWSDVSGNLWLFGGQGRDSTNNVGILNDLWRFDGTNWTWMAGSNTRNVGGVYGTKGVPNPSNYPGSRYWSAQWMDSQGRLWLFGGSGYDATTSVGNLNDLWKLEGGVWTWISGSNSRNPSGVYGTINVAQASNVPGSRNSIATWVDKNDHLWMFGASGLDSTGTSGLLNDVWKFDGTNWTWIKGSNLVDSSGSPGTMGVTNPSNNPIAMANPSLWYDSNGVTWIFGGITFVGCTGAYQSLWKFDGSDWTWVSGINNCNGAATFGTKGVPATSTLPNGTYGAAFWQDPYGSFWSFGGYDAASFTNTLWRLNP